MLVEDDHAWGRCRDALAVETARVVALLRSLPGAQRRAAVGTWSLAEVAVHLSQTSVALSGLARADLAALDAVLPDRDAGGSVARSMQHLGTVTTSAVAAEPERDLGVLAERIESGARDHLAACERDLDPDRLRPWVITGLSMPAPVFTAHLLSETVVHGWDIARAAGRPWRIDPVHAALVVRWFLLSVLSGGLALFPDRARLAAARGSYRLAIRCGDPVRLVLDDAGARLDADPDGPVDCRLWADPVAFLLMFFGRRGLAGTVARGGLVVAGRKPWLALRLRAALPTP